jgi:hypothetical protein
MGRMRKKFMQLSDEILTITNKAKEILSAAKSIGTVKRILYLLPAPEKQKAIVERSRPIQCVNPPEETA